MRWPLTSLQGKTNGQNKRFPCSMCAHQQGLWRGLKIPPHILWCDNSISALGLSINIYVTSYMNCLEYSHSLFHWKKVNVRTCFENSLADIKLILHSNIPNWISNLWNNTVATARCTVALVVLWIQDNPCCVILLLWWFWLESLLQSYSRSMSLEHKWSGVKSNMTAYFNTQSSRSNIKYAPGE